MLEDVNNSNDILRWSFVWISDRVNDVLSDAMKGFLTDVVIGTLTAALSVLAFSVIVVIGGVIEVLIKLLTDVIEGVTVMRGYTVMGDAITGCSLVWDMMVGEALIGVIKNDIGGFTSHGIVTFSVRCDESVLYQVYC